MRLIRYISRVYFEYISIRTDFVPRANVIRRGESYDVYDNDSDERGRGRPKETTLQGLLRLNDKMYARTKEGTGLNEWSKTHARTGGYRGNIFRD